MVPPAHELRACNENPDRTVAYRQTCYVSCRPVFHAAHEVHGIVDYGTHLVGVHLAILAEDGLVDERVHDLADEALLARPVLDFLDYAFHGERELLDDGSIHMLGGYEGEAARCGLVDLAPGSDAKVVCLHHMLLRRPEPR